MSTVMLMLEWPSWRLTTWIGIPASSIVVAAELLTERLSMHSSRASGWRLLKQRAGRLASFSPARGVASVRTYRPGEVGLGQVCAGQVRPGEVGLGEIRAGQVRPGEVGLGEIRAGQIRPVKVTSE